MKALQPNEITCLAEMGFKPSTLTVPCMSKIVHKPSGKIYSVYIYVGDTIYITKRLYSRVTKQTIYHSFDQLVADLQCRGEAA